MECKKRLIDANEYPCQNCEISYCYKNCDKFNAWLEKTVDAVEVVHGRWITDQVEAFNPLTEEPYLLDVLQCSVCGEYFDVSEARNYCPNCGAKMDGKEKDSNLLFADMEEIIDGC